MLPTLKDNDIVFFKKYIPNKSLLKVGQIIIFYHPLKGIRLIKRIKNVRKYTIEIFGDNIEYSDDSNKFGLINNEKIIGIVTSKLFNSRFKIHLTNKERSTLLNPK